MLSTEGERIDLEREKSSLNPEDAEEQRELLLVNALARPKTLMTRAGCPMRLKIGSDGH